MLKSMNYLIGSFLFLFFVACSQEDKPVVEESFVDVDEIISILIGEGQSTKIGGPAPPSFEEIGGLVELEASLVNMTQGCFTVNIRVYVYGEPDGTRWQIASDVVTIGDGCVEERSFNNTKCNGELPDGNKVMENNIQDRICLLELLTKSELVYDLYEQEISQYN